MVSCRDACAMNVTKRSLAIPDTSPEGHYSLGRRRVHPAYGSSRVYSSSGIPSGLSFRKARSPGCFKRPLNSTLCGWACRSCLATGRRSNGRPNTSAWFWGIRIINPAQSPDLDSFVKRFVMLRRGKGIAEEEAREAMSKPNYSGAMMVAMRQADSLVSGTNEISGSVLRPLFPNHQGRSEDHDGLLLHGDGGRGYAIRGKGVLFMGDCGVIPIRRSSNSPTSGSTSHGWPDRLWERAPRGVPSYSKGERGPPSVLKVRAATALAAQKAKDSGFEAEIDGEMQVDAALMPDIAVRKLPESRVAGRANVLVFPDLNSGNIALKLIQHIARANAYGQILLGLDRPGCGCLPGQQRPRHPSASPPSSDCKASSISSSIPAPAKLFPARCNHAPQQLHPRGFHRRHPAKRRQNHPIPSDFSQPSGAFRPGGLHIKPVGQRFVEIDAERSTRTPSSWTGSSD